MVRGVKAAPARIAARRSPRKPMMRREWSLHVERATLDRAGRAATREARSAFERLGPGAQMALAREIAQTRSSELCLAYKNVVMVAAGYKTRRTRGNKVKIERIPCVTFIVRAKWKGEGSERNKDQLLPKSLLAYASIDGWRSICAVPTDVVLERGFFGAKTHASSGIAVQRTSENELGNTPCAAIVRHPNGQGDLVLMSCQHVLTPLHLASNPFPTPGTPVKLHDGSAALLGTTSDFGGQLRADGNPSFDVQFANVVAPELLPAALGFALSQQEPYIGSAARLDEIAYTTDFWIFASPNIGSPRKLPIRASFLRYVPDTQGLKYPFIVDGKVIEIPVNHRCIVMLMLTGPGTIPGDSGSPALMQREDGTYTLLGMHIAAGPEDGYTYSYVIPAWMLFDADQYSVLPEGATVEPRVP